MELLSSEGFQNDESRAGGAAFSGVETMREGGSVLVAGAFH
jgi:hypothetical protein